jgi:hypothetical protein
MIKADRIFCLAVGIAVYDEFFSCMCAAEFVCALYVFARHRSSRITFLTLTIVGRSRGDVSSHQDVFQTFGFPEGQDRWFFEDFTQFWVFLYGCPVLSAGWYVMTNGTLLFAFFDHANNVHSTMKFTHETSRNNISFLDTYTTCENGIMSTDIYNKPTRLGLQETQKFERHLGES